MRRPIRFISALTLSALVLVTTTASAEESRRRVPLLGIHLQPSLSLTFGSDSVTEVYGSAHPTGSIGISIHPLESFYLILELEAHGWNGTFSPPDSTPIDLTFLNYWLHFRGRIFVYQRGRFGLAIDADFGLLFSREDGERFRAEGQGVSIAAGPAIQINLGEYVALSLCALVGSGWAWYDFESPQTIEGDNDYSLSWPRVLIGLALHGFVIRRTVHLTRTAEPAPTVGPAPTDEGQDSPASPFDF